MSVVEAADGVLTRTGDTYELVYRRRIPRPIEKVWAAITVPERIADWFATMVFTPDVRVGATIVITFSPTDRTPGKVVALEPPRLFVWNWPRAGGEESLVRFELTPDGDGCLLTFSQTGLIGETPDGLASISAGWHGMLDGITAAADGVSAHPSSARERSHLERYRAAVSSLSMETGEPHEP